MKHTTTMVTVKTGLSPNGVRRVADRLGLGELNAQGCREFTDTDVKTIAAYLERSKRPANAQRRAHG